MKAANRFGELNSRTLGQLISLLSLFTREELLCAVLPLVPVVLFWICKGAA